MNRIQLIIKEIDIYLDVNMQLETTPAEVNSFLEKKGVLKDSKNRKGKPLRDILRKGLVPHAYQIGNRWFIPKSGTKIDLTTLEKTTTFPISENKQTKRNASKLEPIAKLVAEILEQEFKIKPKYSFEYSPDWLKSFPTKADLPKHWNLMTEIYSELNENKLEFELQIGKVEPLKRNKTQLFDIWFHEPFNFAVEFDEKQHFNQFRKITLSHYGNFEIGFDIRFYSELNNCYIKAGKSGFTKLKSVDSLFPELMEGENQDNRIRQRAFRDFLKDLIPVAIGYNATIRIPYHIANEKIKYFNDVDLESISEYLYKNKLIFKNLGSSISPLE